MNGYKNCSRAKAIQTIHRQVMSCLAVLRNPGRESKKVEERKSREVQRTEKRYKNKNTNANYERVKTWRRENPDLHKAQKQQERHAKQRKATEQQRDSALVGFQCTDETQIIVNILMANMDHHQPLKVITFECKEAIASEQQQQDAVSEFDLSLLDM